ncbi:MAG: hypothetical protein LCH84_00855 [Gemmatimonadetes bacterium]|nr:hypothetical protein [Gemmatimonadota bacterium]
MQHVKRSAFTLVEIIIAISAVAVAGTGLFAYAQYLRVGRGPDNRCTSETNASAATVCEGYPPGELTSSPEIIRWLSTRTWRPERITATRRTVTQGGPLKTMTLQALSRTDMAELRELKSRGLVIARIEGDPESDEDQRYGIGGAETKGRGLQRAFIFVAEPFRLKYPTFVGRLLSNAPSYPIGAWTLYGQTAAGQLVAVKRGTLRWCAHAHTRSVTLDPAQFIDCDSAERAATIHARLLRDPRIREARFDSLSARLRVLSIVRVIRDIPFTDTTRAARQAQIKAEFQDLIDDRELIFFTDLTFDVEDDPVWVRCGVGCCTTDQLES